LLAGLLRSELGPYDHLDLEQFMRMGEPA